MARPTDPAIVPRGVDQHGIRAVLAGAQVSIVLPALEEGSWYFYQRRVEGEFRAAGCWGIISGTERRPDNEQELRDWTRRDELCMNAFMRSLSNDQLAVVVELRSAAEMWEALQRRYAVRSDLRRDALFNKLLLFPKMQSGSSLESHIAKFQLLVKQYESAGGPEVGAVRSQLSESMQRAIFTNSLTDELFDFSAALRARVLTFPEFLQTLIDETEVRNTMRGVARGQSALNTTPDSAGMSGKALATVDKSRIKCFKCGKLGHMKSECRSRLGTERGTGTDSARNSAGSGSAKPRVCFSCGKEGHFRHQCPENKSAGNTRHSGGQSGQVPQMLMVGSGSDSLGWVIDSGATRHAVRSTDGLSDCEQVTQFLSGADGAGIKVSHKGTALLTAVVGSERKASAITDVLVAPGLRENLFSVPVTCQRGNAVIFVGDNAWICDAKDIVKPQKLKAVGLRGPDDLWRIQGSYSHPAMISTAESDAGLWHRRYGHIAKSSLDMLAASVKGVKGQDCIVCDDCQVCAVGKMTRAAIPGTSNPGRATRKLQLVHSDVCGPITPASWGGSQYFVTFTDDFSRRIWAFPMRLKSETFQCFRRFKVLAEVQCGERLAVLRCDRGGEFRGFEFSQFCMNEGIDLQFTPPRTPEYNGVAERLNRTLEERVSCMLADRKAPHAMWAECLVTAAYLKNLTPMKLLKGLTPEEMWTGEKPDVSHLRVWGSTVDVLIPSAERGKFQEKSWRGVFIGYDGPAYKVWDPLRVKVYVSRDVTFHEGVDPVWSAPEATQEGENPTTKTLPITFFPEIETPGNSGIERRSDGAEDQSGSGFRGLEDSYSGQQEAETESSEETRQSGPTEGSLQSADTTETGTHNQNARVEQSSVPVQGVRRSNRVRRPLGPYDRFGPFPVSLLQGCLETEEWEAASFAGLSYLTSGGDPESVEEAMSMDDAAMWWEAIQDELRSQEENGTWVLVDKPVGKNIVSSKMLFKKKFRADGSVERYKARLVARGFSQTRGLDYDETFAPVVKFQSVRAVISSAAANGWTLQQMDVKTAFLQGVLKEEVYMEQPQGLEVAGQEQKVCRLHKSIYGLKQSPRAWYERLESEMVRWGFTRCESDHSIFTRGKGESLVIVTVYVDDLIITGPSKEGISATKQELSGVFRMVDLGDLNYFLGIEVLRGVEGDIQLSQRKYAEAVLKRFGMDQCKPLGIPLLPKTSLVSCAEGDQVEYPYREVVGSLMYLMVATRPDLAAAVSMVSKFLERSGKDQVEAVKRILRYVRGTVDMCLGFKKGMSLQMYGYVDANWGGCLESRRSTSGYVFLLAGGAISWKSKKQDAVALSSTEAEYMAACLASKEAVWLRRLLKELGVLQTTPTEIFTDNQSSLKLMENPVLHERTKHVDIQYHFTRDCIISGQTRFQFLRTNDQAADSLTKGVPEPKVKFCNEVFGLASRQV